MNLKKFIDNVAYNSVEVNPAPTSNAMESAGLLAWLYRKGISFLMQKICAN
jgi:hypothetical protein